MLQIVKTHARQYRADLEPATSHEWQADQHWHRLPVQRDIPRFRPDLDTDQWIVAIIFPQRMNPLGVAPSSSESCRGSLWERQYAGAFSVRERQLMLLRVPSNSYRTQSFWRSVLETTREPRHLRANSVPCGPMKTTIACSLIKKLTSYISPHPITGTSKTA